MGIQNVTARELEIINLSSQGLTAIEIGDRLDISKRTVDAHNDNVKRKLDAKSQVQVVAMCFRSGLLS